MSNFILQLLEFVATLSDEVRLYPFTKMIVDID